MKTYKLSEMSHIHNFVFYRSRKHFKNWRPS